MYKIFSGKPKYWLYGVLFLFPLCFAFILHTATKTNAGDLFYSNGSGWSKVDGCAKNVGVGSNGAIWVVGCNPASGGYAIHRRRTNRQSGPTWQQMPRGAVKIAVSPDGFPSIVNSAGEIFRWDGPISEGNDGRIAGDHWTKLPGCATDIGVGKNGKIWIIGCNVTNGGYDPRWQKGGLLFVRFDDRV